MTRNNTSESNPKENKLSLDVTLVELRASLLQSYLNGSLILGSIIFLTSLYFSIQNKSTASTVIIIVLYSALFLVTFVRQMPLDLRVWSLVLIYFSAGVFSVFQGGINSTGILFFFISVLAIGVFFRGALWIFGLVGSGVAIATISTLSQYNLINLGRSTTVSTSPILTWVSITTTLLFLLFVIVAPLSQYLSNIRQRYVELRKNELALQQDNESLLVRIQSTESSFDRRNSLMITGRQITRELANSESVEKLFSETVNLIQNQFGYSFAGVYLSDSINEYAFFKSGTGSTGQSLLEQNYKIRIQDESLIGYAIRKGEYKVALEAGTDSVQTVSSLLPGIRSELALPIKSGNRIIGAIDLQSENENLFTDAEIEVLQNVVDQLGASFLKISQIENLDREVKDLQTTYSGYTQNLWQTHLKGSRRKLQYTYKNDRLIEKEVLDNTEQEVLESTRKKINLATNKSQRPESTIAVPIMLRDQILGVINLKYKGKTIPRGLDALIETAASRLASSLENARLLEEIQERADRERVVGTIATKVRSATNIDSILQATATEIGKSLGVDEVRIQLKTPGLEDK